MRIFHDRLSKDKGTDESVRWIKRIDQVPFQLYIFRGRIPRTPPPAVIEVSIFSDKALFHRLLVKVGNKSVSQLTDEDKVELRKIGLDEDQLQIAGQEAIFGAAFKPEKGHIHTKTMRYNAGKKELEFGDPYIPQSILGDSSPNYLLFLVRWIEDPA
jgi:hypothetical protein